LYLLNAIQVPASQGDALSETVVAPLQENGVASHTRLAGEGCTSDEIASRDLCRITNGQPDNGQESDEVISTARGSTRYGSTAEGEMAIHALLNHAIGLDQCCNSGPAASLFANATLAALGKAASSVQTPTTLEGLSQNRVLEESCTESSASLFDKDTNPLMNSNMEKGVHFVRDVKGSSLQGSNSLDSRLVAALPKLEFFRQGSEYALNFPQGITIASADGGVFLEATYPDDLGFLPSEDARQQYQGPSETNLTVSVRQQNDTCEPLESFDTRPQGPDALVGADHEVSEEDQEKIDWSVATTTSNEAEVVDHGSESGHKEHSRAENEKQEIDCVHHDVVFKSLSGENGEMMQGAGEESPECKLLPSVAEQEALQVEVAKAEVQYPAPSNTVVGDQFSDLQDNISEDVQINSMIQPDLEDTRTVDVRDGSTQCKEGPEIAHVCATEPVVSLPSEENPTSSTHEGDPSPGVEAAIVQERAWRDATDKAAAVLRASPLCAKSHRHKTGLDRKTKTGGALRSTPKGYNQSLPSNSTPAVLDKNMQLTKPAQKKTDVLEQSDRKPWLWWGWRGTPSLPKQRSDQDEKKETKEVKATTNQAGEDNTQVLLNAPKVNSQSLGIVDDQNSSMREGDKMLRENDAQESNGEEAVVSSTGKSSTVVKRTKESSTEHTEGEGSEVEEKEEKGELSTEVVSSNTTQNSEGKEAENPARRSILGLLFRGYGKEQTLASPDSALERESSLERAEIISDLLDNSWGYGSGVKSRKSPRKLNSQEPLVISSCNSHNVATAKDSQAKASDSQMSLTGQTMGPEELVINERSDVPFNNDSTLDSSLHLQAGGGCSTEAAEDSCIPRLSEPSFNHADCTTTAHCPSSVSIHIAAGGKGPDIVRDEDTPQDSGEFVLHGGRSNAADSDNGSIVSDSNMNRKEKLAGVSLAVTTCAVLMDDMEGASSMVSLSPDRLQDEEVNEDVNSLATCAQELTSLHECAKRVSFPVVMNSMTVRTKLQEQEVIGENTFLVKDPAVLPVEELVGADKEQISTAVTEVMPVSCAGLDVMALTDPVNACSSIEDSTIDSPVLSLDEEKPSNKGDDTVENSDLQEGVSEEKVPPLSPVQDEVMVGGAGASSSKLLSRNLAVLETSPTWNGASHTQTYVVEVTQTMPVTTKVLEIVKAGEALADTGEMGEVATTLHAGNSSEGELENPLSYSDAGASNRKSTYVEANTSKEQEEEVHRKLAVMKIDHVASAPHGENMSDDELENPLSYSHIGSASGKSIYFEANTSEDEEEEEGNGEVVDADKDLEMLGRKSDPIGIPVSLENSALDDLFVIAKDRPLSESLPDVRLQSADAAISGIWSALSRSVGSEPLPHTKRSSSRRDSCSYVMSPAEGTHEQVDGFPQNIFEEGVGSPAGSGQSGDEDGAEADGMETAAETGLSLSFLMLEVWPGF
jgi:hypothetical protein